MSMTSDSSGGIGNTHGADLMAAASDVPNLKVLQDELQYAWDMDKDQYGLTAWKEDIRYTRWEHQSADGLKHSSKKGGYQANPYERASDTRIMLTDDIINGWVDILYAAFFGARSKVSPTSAKRLNVMQAAELRAVVTWMLQGPLLNWLLDNVEFTAQVMLTIGWCVLHPTWRKEKVLRTREITMDQVRTATAWAVKQRPDSPLAQAEAMILDPALEDAAIDLVRMLVPELDTKEKARKVVKGLRETGAAEYAAAEDGPNVPEIKVLVPGQHFVLPPESTALPTMARWMPLRIFFTEQALEQQAQEEGWDGGFVERAKKTKGQSISNRTVEHDVDQNLKDIEIFYMFQQRNNEDGVPGLYCTIFSMFVNPDRGETKKGDYAKHWLLTSEDNSYPFIVQQFEVTGLRPMDSRGIPDMVHTQQNEMKNSRDGLFTYQQLSVTPPLQKKGTQASKLPPEFGPLAILNNVNGEWSWFPPPAGNPEIAIELTNTVRKEAEDYCGLARTDTPPQRWMGRQQRIATRWLGKWGMVLMRLAELAYQNLAPEELEQILGRKPLLTSDMIAQQALLMSFDVRALNSDWVKGMISDVSTMVAPMDTGGKMDHNKAVGLVLSYLDPSIEQEITSDEAGASQAVFKQVRDEIGAVMQGNEALYTENDPTAKMKLKFAQQVLGGNPEYQEQLTEGSQSFNPRKRELLEKYMKNLQQSAAQQDNKVVGRLGVRPGQ